MPNHAGGEFSPQMVTLLDCTGSPISIPSTDQSYLVLGSPLWKIPILSSISEETHQVMKNISEVLKAAEMDFSNVVKCSIFMKDMGQYSEINDVYASYFSENPPAREAVEVSVLPKNVNVEISVIAEK